jgi:DNA-binding NarL/FixJ family response regulator
VVDDHPIVLDVMAAMAHKVFAGATVHCAVSLAEAQQTLAGDAPLDMAMLDLGLPGCRGIEALMQFRLMAPSVPVVVISANEERAIVLGALQAGANGYIFKTAKPDVIFAALRLVAAGGIHVPPEVFLEQPARKPSGLTERQLDVLRLIAQGLANKQIAQRLRIANETVKQHAKAVFNSLGIASRSQAARAAEQRGIKL